mgnify:CR=1 FL=1
MRNNILILLITLSVFACKNDKQSKEEVKEDKKEIAYTSIGENILADGALKEGDMTKVYFNMKQGDTIQSKMVAKVDEVCQAKGCWMKLSLQNGKQVMVKFKDYGFFMPKDIAGKEVIVNGKAFVNEMSVDEQRHYAEDAGESAEKIAAITHAKRTYSFEADGVLLKE